MSMAQSIRRPGQCGAAMMSLLFASTSIPARSFFAAAYKPVHYVHQAEKVIEISPPEGQPITASLVFMHGLGDTAFGWGGAMLEVASKIPGLRVYLPTASEKAVTLNGGYKMPSWYDIKSLEKNRANDDCDGIEDSRNIVIDLLEKEKNEFNLKENQLFVGGFSQGGALSLYTGLQFDGQKPLGGVICLSGYLANAGNWRLSEAGRRTRLGMFHGVDDPVVKLEWARQSFDKIKEAGMREVDLKEYQGLEHSATMEELEDVVTFLKNAISSASEEDS